MELGWLRWRAWAGVGRGDAAAVGVAGVAFGDMHVGFTWQARHSVTVLTQLARTHNLPAHNLSTHKSLTHSLRTHNLSTHNFLTQPLDLRFCVAGVARMALGWLRWRAWAGVGRGDAAAVGVAGVAFGDMHLGSTWQAWRSVTSTSAFVSRGRRGAW